LPPGADQERPQRALVPQRGYWIALIALTGLITYGSLYPFEFRAGPEVAEQLRAFTHDQSPWTSLGDVLGNLALFVPLGFLSALAYRRSSPGVVLGFLAFALTLSAGLQALQAFLPSRTPAMADVLWNGVGYVAGLAGGSLAANWITSRRAAPDRRDGIALTVVVFWVAAELLPLVPALDLTGLKAAVRPLIYAPHADLAAITARAAAVLLVARIVEGRLGAVRALALIPPLPHLRQIRPDLAPFIPHAMTRAASCLAAEEDLLAGGDAAGGQLSVKSVQFLKLLSGVL